ncbi:MAG: hypothetical protein AAGI11_19705 [Pseudomonadota bacterium]
MALIFSLNTLAQNTCFTGTTGTTICSTSSGVIHGNTNSVGNSVYRDSRGNRLDMQTDRRGTARVETANGEVVNWSQQVLGEKKYPETVKREGIAPPHPADLRPPIPLDTWLQRAHP